MQADRKDRNIAVHSIFKEEREFQAHIALTVWSHEIIITILKFRSLALTISP